MKSKLTKNQVKTFEKRVSAEGPYDYDRIKVTVQYDDQCGNGHNTFSITGETTVRGREDMGGCIHDEIAKHFPDLKPLLKWHLCSSDGPMHYIANTTYNASDKDHRGMRKGEKKQLHNGKSGLPVWEPVTRDENGNRIDTLHKWVDSEEKPDGTFTTEWEPVWIVGEGKEPDLEAARRSAIWPDATLEQLQDKAALTARLPALLDEFKSAVESLGFTF